jgi:hypothetical protein
VQVSYFIPLQKQLPPLWWTRAAKTNAICHRHVGSMFIVINNSREKERRALCDGRAALRKRIIRKQNKQESRQDERRFSHGENAAADVMTTLLLLGE